MILEDFDGRIAIFTKRKISPYTIEYIQERKSVCSKEYIIHITQQLFGFKMKIYKRTVTTFNHKLKFSPSILVEETKCENILTLHENLTKWILNFMEKNKLKFELKST